MGTTKCKGEKAEMGKTRNTKRTRREAVKVLVHESRKLFLVKNKHAKMSIDNTCLGWVGRKGGCTRIRRFSKNISLLRITLTEKIRLREKTLVRLLLSL